MFALSSSCVYVSRFVFTNVILSSIYCKCFWFDFAVYFFRYLSDQFWCTHKKKLYDCIEMKNNTNQNQRVCKTFTFMLYLDGCRWSVFVFVRLVNFYFIKQIWLRNCCKHSKLAATDNNHFEKFATNTILLLIANIESFSNFYFSKYACANVMCSLISCSIDNAVRFPVGCFR